MGNFIPQNVACCKTCGHVTYYKGLSGKYECNKTPVEPTGICDRYTKNCSPQEVMRRICKSMNELQSAPDGKYEIKKRPPFMQNYRLLTEEELKR